MSDLSNCEKRTCAYCGAEKCEHVYRFGRKFKGFRGALAVRGENISAQTTLGEFKEEIEQYLSGDPSTPMTWMFSFTKRGEPKP